MYVHLPLYVQEKFLEQSDNGRYGAAVECIDWVTGMIRYELENLAIDKNTLILFTSDNGSRVEGDGSNLPLRGGKGSTWEGGQRLPLIAWWPGTVKAGRKVDNIVSSIDFLPSFAELSGVSLPEKKIDGISFYSQLTDKKDNYEKRDTFFYFFEDRLEALRMGKWKLFFYRDGKHIKELYNLEKDIGESQNLYYSNPEIVQKLKLKAERIRNELGDAVVGIEGNECRNAGKVSNPEPLCVYNEKYPYYMAEYDLEDRG